MRIPYGARLEPPGEGLMVPSMAFPGPHLAIITRPTAELWVPDASSQSGPGAVGRQSQAKVLTNGGKSYLIHPYGSAVEGNDPLT